MHATGLQDGTTRKTQALSLKEPLYATRLLKSGCQHDLPMAAGANMEEQGSPSSSR